MFTLNDIVIVIEWHLDHVTTHTYTSMVPVLTNTQTSPDMFLRKLDASSSPAVRTRTLLPASPWWRERVSMTRSTCIHCSTHTWLQWPQRSVSFFPWLPSSTTMAFPWGTRSSCPWPWYWLCAVSWSWPCSSS